MMKNQRYFILELIIGVILLAGCQKRLPDPQVIINPTKLSPTATATATPTASPTPTLQPTVTMIPTATPDVISYDVEPLSQDGLYLNGASTGVGCVPVCIEMITSWWHSVSTDYPILTAQETIDRNAEQGLYIAGRGMTSASAADELAALGYVHEMYINSSKEEMLAAFKAHGPIGVLVKTNWIPTTMNHAAVLIYYDPESDTVRLNDPFYGSTVTWSWESFDGIWGLNYAGDSDYSGRIVQRVWFTIYPKGTD